MQVKRLFATAFLITLTLCVGLVPAAVPPKINPATDWGWATFKTAPKDDPKPGPVAPFKIVGLDTPVQLPGYALLTTTAVPGQVINWEFDPEPVKKDDLGGVQVVVGLPDIKYTVRADFINFDTKTSGKAKGTLQFLADPNCAIRPPPVPPTPVPPGPTPNPTPGPTATAAFFAVVEDTSKPGAWRGQMLGDPEVASFYTQLSAGRGKVHLILDVNGDTSDPKWAVIVADAKTKPTLPWLYQFDANGNKVKDLACPTDSGKSFIATFQTPKTGAVTRSTGLILAKPKLKWNKFGSNPAVPLIEQGQWKPVDMKAYLPPVHDQDGRGQCASSSACGATEACQNMAGLPYEELSAGDLYARVNGGADNGSLLEDNMAELTAHGVVPTSYGVPYIWDGRRPKTDSATVAARKPNRVVEVYLCDSFEAIGSAIQQGFFVQIGIMWPSNDTPDANGCIGPSRGAVGGHALFIYGAKQVNGQWYFLTRNSWGTTWGGSRDGSVGAGSCLLPASYFTGDIGGWWALRAVVAKPTPAYPTPKLTKLFIRDADIALAF